MLSKNQQKLLRQLGQKKYRKQQQQFLVQGGKNVIELLNSDYAIDELFASDDFIAANAALISKRLPAHKVHAAEQSQLTKVSTLVTNNDAIAVAPILEQEVKNTPWQLALDGVSDPGNLGTIIRLADWYGFEQVILSPTCADPHNPKVISATMGSFTRISCVSVDLQSFLANSGKPVYGAFLEGDNIHQCDFGGTGVLVMGSESHGISSDIEACVSDKVTIAGIGQAESLNVAIATGIILDNINRCQS